MSVFATVVVILFRASDSKKRGSSAGEGRGKRSHGRLRISEAMKGTSLIFFSYLQTRLMCSMWASAFTAGLFTMSLAFVYVKNLMIFVMTSFWGKIFATISEEMP